MALRNHFVVLFKGYALQLIPAHRDIYKSAFCKQAANLGEERKHPEFKVIPAALQEISVCQRREVWKAQGRGRADNPWWVHGQALVLPFGTDGHIALCRQWGDSEEFCHVHWDVIVTGNQHFSSLIEVPVGNDAVMPHQS